MKLHVLQRAQMIKRVLSCDSKNDIIEHYIPQHDGNTQLEALPRSSDPCPHSNDDAKLRTSTST